MDSLLDLFQKLKCAVRPEWRRSHPGFYSDQPTASFSKYDCELSKDELKKTFNDNLWTHPLKGDRKGEESNTLKILTTQGLGDLIE